MTGNRLTRALSVLLAVSMLAFAMGTSALANSAARPQRALTSVTLVLKWVPQAQFAGYFIALDKGFYRAQGLDVTIKPGGPDVVPETVVASGGAQFGIDWLSALLAARDRKVPIVNIAQIFQASGMRIITFKSTGINSIAKFRNKRVGVWFAGNEYQFMALMKKYKMSPPGNYMTVVQQQFVMTDFLTHKLDVAHAMTYNELGVVLEAGVKLSQLNVFDYNKLGVSILEDGIFSNQSWVKSHSSIAAKFLKASIQGWGYAVAHTTEAGTISYHHAPPGTTTLHHQIYMAQQVAKLINFGAGLSHPIGYMDPVTFHRTWSTLKQQGVIKKTPKNAYDQSYWKAALK
jgi:NitT/TauT family transport system substrate-binding protein